MDDQNEPANVVVGYVNCIESETGYEEFNHNRTQESAYMAIGTTDNNGTNRHQSNPHGNSTKMDKFEKALVQLATTLKILKLISAILVIAVVVVSVTFGILIYKMVS